MLAGEFIDPVADLLVGREHSRNVAYWTKLVQ
jgi:hypothetical protein